MNDFADTPSHLGTKGRLAALEGRADCFGEMLARHQKTISALLDDRKMRSDGPQGAGKAPSGADSPVMASGDTAKAGDAVGAPDGPISWGREIEVDGKRPDWLTDDATPVKWAHRYSTDVTIAGNLKWDNGSDGGAVETIRLPADHDAYHALAAGFTPWAGGDAAPEDWTGDPADVIYRDGKTEGRVPNWWGHHLVNSDIIGYHKRADSADTLTAATDRLNAQTAEMRGEAPAIDWTRPIELSDGTAAEVMYTKPSFGYTVVKIGDVDHGRAFENDGSPVMPDDGADYPVKLAGRTIRNVAEPKHVGITADDLIGRQNAIEMAHHVNRELSERLVKVEAERDELRAAIPEWLCDKCQTIYTKPANPFTLACPNCAGMMRPTSVNERQAEAALAEEVNRCARMSDTIYHQREEIGKMHAKVGMYTEGQRELAVMVARRHYIAFRDRDEPIRLEPMVDDIAAALGVRKAEG